MIRAPAVAVLMGLLYVFPAAAEEITGKARAVDGDTMRVGQTVVRLYGVDAPEMAQTCTTGKGREQKCGDLARQMLNTLTKNIDVKCRGENRDPDGTLQALCFAGPFDINEQMIASGWALPVIDEVPGYKRAETFARARREGMWRGTFIPAWQWRRENGVE